MDWQTRRHRNSMKLLEVIQTVLRQNWEQNSADKPTQPGSL